MLLASARSVVFAHVSQYSRRKKIEVPTGFVTQFIYSDLSICLFPLWEAMGHGLA